MQRFFGMSLSKLAQRNGKAPGLDESARNREPSGDQDTDGALTVREFVSAGFVLLAFFVIVFSFVVVLISAFQLQHEVDAASAKDIHATMGQIRADVQALDVREAMTAETERLQNKNNALIKANKYKRDRAKEGIESATREAELAISKLKWQYRDFEAAQVELLPLDGTLDLNARLSVYEKSVQDRAANMQVPPKKVEDFFAAFTNAVGPSRNDYSAARATYDELGLLEDQYAVEAERLSHPPKELAARLGEGAGAYMSVVDDFRSYENLLWGFPYWFVFLPSSMLVLLLSVFMGMQGSLIYLARRLVLEKVATDWGEMLFRIGLGAGVALALFVFTTVGALTLQTSSGSEMTMGPYLISFLGIMAGYLSDRVTAWMREVGEKTFKLEKGVDQDRWAIGLQSVTTAQGVALPDLAKAVGASASELQEWCDLKKSVPSEIQKALALYLHTDRSRLFTDLDPAAP